MAEISEDCDDSILKKACDYVLIEEGTYTAMNIANQRMFTHQAFHKTTDFKNSSDLFSLFNRCKTSAGSEYLWSMFKHPTKNIDVLNERLDFVEYCKRISNPAFVKNLLLVLPDIIDLKKVIYHPNPDKMTKDNWITLDRGLKSFLRLRIICEPHENGPAILPAIINLIDDDIFFMKYFMDRVLDLYNQNVPDIAIKEGVDEGLDALQKIHVLLPGALSNVYSENLETIPPEIEHFRLVFIPMFGYALAVTKWKNSVPINHSIGSFQYAFTTNNVNYFRTLVTKRLDETFNNVHKSIQVRVARLMAKMRTLLANNTAKIAKVIQMCAQLDALISVYLVANELKLVRPVLTHEHVILILEGWHPLHGGPSFIANSVVSDNDNSIKIINGPTHCGKSLYLKQLTIIVFLAQIGSFVPAKSATIGIVDCIVTKFTTHESMSFETTSTFSEDIKHIQRALAALNKNALIVLDELGKGTLEMDAAIILSSMILEFINNPENNSHLFLVAHTPKIIKLIGVNVSKIQILTFEYFIKNNQITFLYKLKIGFEDHNHAFLVAELLLSDKSLFALANKVKTAIKSSKIERLESNCKRGEVNMDFAKKLFTSHDVENLLINFQGNFKL